VNHNPRLPKARNTVEESEFRAVAPYKGVEDSPDFGVACGDLRQCPGMGWAQGVGYQR